MPETIQIGLAADTFRVLADGKPVRAEVIVRNIGTAVDQYALVLDGLPHSWYTMRATTGVLFPQDKETVELLLCPPPGLVKAGVYPFTVAAAAVADRSQTRLASSRMEVAAVTTLDLTLTPHRVIGHTARFEVTAHNNNSNVDVDLDFDVRDEDDYCYAVFRPRAPRVEAGRQVTVRMKVRAHRHRVVGKRQPCQLQVTARPSHGEPRTVRVEFEHTPWLGSWRPLRRLLLLVVVVFTIGVPYPRNPVKQFFCMRTAVCTLLHAGWQLLGAEGSLTLTPRPMADWPPDPYPRDRRSSAMADWPPDPYPRDRRSSAPLPTAGETLSPAQIMHHLKGTTSHALRGEFPALRSRLPSLWTSSYYVGTAGNVSSETIRRYIDAQKGV